MASDAFQICVHPSAPDCALATLAEPVAHWIRNQFINPTLAQRFAWPVLQRGENLLLSAPTGTGKTLAAFLPIISILLNEPADGLTCLYVSPMKALGRDVGKNLRRYVRQIMADTPNRIRIGLRTGDTSAHLRRRQFAQPPHILLTTPESLAILLANPQAAEFFRNLRWIVVDEIHALAGNKRGADLSLSLERLTPRDEYSNPASPPQRIGLSATCSPLSTIADFLVGTNRPCTIAAVPDNSPLDLTLEPFDAGGQSFVTNLVNRLEIEMASNRTTLVFTNSRALAERLTWALKRRFPEKQQQIAVHHSSLSAPRRRSVERRLKMGRMEVVVTSTSLELGIDIGSVDGVVFVHPPRGVTRFLQRLGRSGHQPGKPRRGLLLTSGPAELLEATVTAAAGRYSQLEPIVPAPHPLDVLCQHLAGMAMTRSWSPDEAYSVVCRAYPYRELSRDDFDHCLAYLSGRHADGRAWLPSRLRWQEGRFAIVSQGTQALLRRNLGTILNEEPRAVRLLGPKPSTLALARSTGQPSFLIGSLDDAYADRLRPGDRLLLDGRCLEYRRRENGALMVDEVSNRPAVPCWMGSGWSLSLELAQRLYLFRQQAADALREGPTYLRDWLRRDYNLGGDACEELADLFSVQESISEIPQTDALLIETVPDDSGHTYYFHTPLHRPGNDALARLLAWRFNQSRGLVGQSIVADLGFALSLRGRQPLDAKAWQALFKAHEFDRDLTAALHDCDSLRERFAQAATIGFMVLRQPIGGRRKVGGHDWIQRRLFDQVRELAPDFVLLRQAEREMRTEICDADAARCFVDDLAKRQVRCRRLGQVSPFAASWTQSGAVDSESSDEILAHLHTELFKS